MLDDVSTHTSRLELRLSTVTDRVEQQTDSANAARRSLAGVNDAVAELARLVDQRLTTLASSVTDAANRPMPQPEVVLDERFALLARTIEGRYDDGTVRDGITALEAEIQRLVQVLEAREVPAAAGTSDVNVGAVEAQVALLSRTVEEGLEAVAKTVRRQEQEIHELRTSIDWVKERLLANKRFR